MAHHAFGVHAAIGALYAQVTAPLRRLVDRYGTEVCLAVSAGQPVPEWVREALPKLPDVMNETGALENRLENAVIDSVEALLLQHSVGKQFPAVVVGTGKESVTVVLDEPAVRAKAAGAARLGDAVQVIVRKADPAKPELVLELTGNGAGH